MPLRLPKMYSFIFGFHRLVWCPKWTPASSSSFMEMEGTSILSRSPVDASVVGWLAPGRRGPGRSPVVVGHRRERRSLAALAALAAFAAFLQLSAWRTGNG